MSNGRYVVGMMTHIFYAMVAAFTAAVLLFPKMITFSQKRGWVDVPSTRRRHSKPIPLVGGLTVFMSWSIAMAFYCYLNPNWMTEHYFSFGIITSGTFLLIALGFIDDTRHLGPKTKLIVEFAVAIATVSFEPNIRHFCAIWQPNLGPFIYFLTVIWIVGVTNAINLIDGLDGLAGGTTLLTSITISVLSLQMGPDGDFSSIVMLALVPTLLGFLLFNWNPAKVFLGDSGSLPLGYLISVTALMAVPKTRLWVMGIGFFLMLGFPILDMGLCVIRRYRGGQPLFRADRNHLHYRILRLGFSVKETTLFLLSFVLFLQLSAVGVHTMNPEAVALSIGTIVAGGSILLYFVRSIELWRVRTIQRETRTELKSLPSFEEATENVTESRFFLTIDLLPLFEAGMLEERTRIPQVIQALRFLLQSATRKEDHIILGPNNISVIFSADMIEPENKQEFLNTFRQRLEQFQTLYNLQYSLAGLPMVIERKPLVLITEHKQEEKKTA